MMIRELTGDGIPIDQSKNRKPASPEKSDPVARTDRAALSGQAMALYASAEEHRIEEIRQRVQDGFYRRHDVLESIVTALLEDLKKEGLG